MNKSYSLWLEFIILSSGVSGHLLRALYVRCTILQCTMYNIHCTLYIVYPLHNTYYNSVLKHKLVSSIFSVEAIIISDGLFMLQSRFYQYFSIC